MRMSWEGSLYLPDEIIKENLMVNRIWYAWSFSILVPHYKEEII